MRVFEENPWFQSLPPEEAAALLRAARPLKLARGETLFRQGDSIAAGTRGLFGVVSGRVKFSSIFPDGTEMILSVIEPGNWLGEVVLLDRLRRAHTATAVSNVELAVVSVEDFDALMQRIDFAHAIARLAASRLRLAMDFIANSVLHSTRERVLHRLLMLAHGDSAQSTNAHCVITTSQDTLAMMLGISRPTLNKELQALMREGVISLHYGRIEIIDQGLLHAQH